MAKFHVHIYDVVRVKVCGITATNHVEAITEAEKVFKPQADQLLNRHLAAAEAEDAATGAVTNIESAEETVRYLVDEVGDDEFCKTRLYDAEMRLIDGDHKQDDAPLEFNVACHSTVGYPSAPTLVHFFIDKEKAQAIIDASEFLYKLDSANNTGGQVQLPTSGRITWMESEGRPYQVKYLGAQHIVVRRKFFSPETEITGLTGTVKTNPLQVSDLARHFGITYSRAHVLEAA